MTSKKQSKKSLKPQATPRRRFAPLPIPVTIPEGYLMDAKGRLVPESLIRQHERLEDKTVRDIIKYADELSGQIGRFKGHTFEDVASFLDLLSARYGQSPRRGMNGKGNIALTSYDGTQRVQVLIADELTFSAGLQVAKEIICSPLSP